MIRTIIYIASVLLVTGCGKDGAEDIPSNGILIEVETPRTSGWSTEENIGTRSHNAKTSRQEGEDGLDMEISTQPEVAERRPDGATTRWANLDDNITFRIVAYKSATAAGITTSNYAGYGDYKLSGSTVQTVKSLAIPAGTYTFICYSYGDANAMAAFNNSSASVSASNGQNFMTCVKPNITINNIGSKYTLSNIVFKHHCARYRVQAIAQIGRMGNITACTGSVTLPNNSATYTFTNGVFKVQAATGSADVTWNSPNAMSVNSNYVYLLPQSSVSMTINLNPTIGEKAFTNKSVKLSGLTFAANNTYYSKVSFTTTAGYIIRGAFWANGNLYYTSATQSYNIYPQMYTYTAIADGGDYWDWNTITPYPTVTSHTTWNDDYDPCRKVLPSNTWRSPTLEEGTKLIETGVWKESTLNGILGVYCDNLVFFPYSGYVFFKTGYPIYGESEIRGLYHIKHPSFSVYMNIDINLNIICGNEHRHNSMSIRCVRNI